MGQGGSHLHARMRAPDFHTYIEKGSTDCADIWCVVGDQLVLSFARTMSGSHLHGLDVTRQSDVPE